MRKESYFILRLIAKLLPHFQRQLPHPEPFMIHKTSQLCNVVSTCMMPFILCNCEIKLALTCISERTVIISHTIVGCFLLNRMVGLVAGRREASDLSVAGHSAWCATYLWILGRTGKLTSEITLYLVTGTICVWNYLCDMGYSRKCLSLDGKSIFSNTIRCISV